MARSPRSRIRIGIGGWSYEPWRGAFYPDGLVQRRELEYASRRLTSIEINSTFYGAQRPESFARWHDETPDDFVFAVKAPRYATHRKTLAEAGASIARFIDGGVTRLRKKLGPINWQFDPNKPFDPDDFARFLDLLPAEADGLPLRHALEVRHASFSTPAFVALAREHRAAIVTAGDAQYPQIADATAPFVYVRIMGTTEAQPLGYAPDALDRWAARALAWAGGDAPDDLATLDKPHASKGGRDVFLYVISGYKVRNPAAAAALIERVRG
ncbi:MAG TPA: DUF72 domain-containing protein [Paraburkholderia sp.]|jgi:uncharacterized protein YecE (DUF72 family)|nr:DUF72 domain-containing protein [Paraburkholderia sp.]